MSKLFLDVLNLSITASWLIVAVLFLRILVFKKTPKWISCLLWAVVGLRLMIPFSFESEISLVPSVETFNTEAVYSEISESPTIPEENFELEVVPENKPSTDTTVDNPIVSENPVPEKRPTYIQSGIDAIDNNANTYINETVNSTSNENETVNPIRSFADIASVVWCFGVAVMLIYAVTQYMLLRRRVSAFITDDKGIRRSEYVGSPFILGMFRPRIYLPFGLSETAEEHIIAHEQAHLKRKDYLIKPFGYAILSVYWFNPLVWLAYIMLCKDIECACDEKVIKDMDPDSRKNYALALVECGVKRSIITACPVAFGEVGVKERVKNALNYKKPMLWIIIIGLIITTVVAVMFLSSPKSENDIQSDSSEEASDTVSEESNDELSNDASESQFDEPSEDSFESIDESSDVSDTSDESDVSGEPITSEEPDSSNDSQDPSSEPSDELSREPSQEPSDEPSREPSEEPDPDEPKKIDLEYEDFYDFETILYFQTISDTLLVENSGFSISGTSGTEKLYIIDCQEDYELFLSFAERIFIPNEEIFRTWSSTDYAKYVYLVNVLESPKHNYTYRVGEAYLYENTLSLEYEYVYYDGEYYPPFKSRHYLVMKVKREDIVSCDNYSVSDSAVVLPDPNPGPPASNILEYEAFYDISSFSMGFTIDNSLLAENSDFSLNYVSGTKKLYIIDSKEDLDLLLSNMENSSRKEDIEAVQAWSSNDFEKTVYIVTMFEAPSGGIEYRIGNVYFEDDSLNINYEQVHTGAFVVDAIIDHLTAIKIDRSEIIGLNKYNITIEDRYEWEEETDEWDFE